MTGVMGLILSGSLPVIFSVGFYLLEKKTRFSKLPYLRRQLIIGVFFGALAIFSTEYSIDVGGASMNVRDAAPLTAGLLFGGPAGIIAGVIGGVERWLAAMWGVGVYTRLACTLATFMAGFIGAGARKLLFDDKKPGWFFGLAIGMTTEVLHMLLVFLTNMSDTHNAFVVVQKCARTMILANSLSVMAAVLCVSLLGKEQAHSVHDTKKISQTFQRWLLLCVIAAFAATSLFTWTLQTRITNANTDYLLRINAEDVCNDISDASDKNLLLLTENIAAQLPMRQKVDDALLCTLAQQYDVTEVNLIDENGVITNSTVPEFVGYRMADDTQSAFFLPLLSGTSSLVQGYQPISFDAGISRKYAGIALPEGGFLQVGYDAQRFQRDIDKEVVRVAKNRHIGQNGCVIICSEDGVIVSDRNGHEGESLQEIGLRLDDSATAEYQCFTGTVHGEPSYCAYTVSEGYYIIAVLPQKEAVFTRDLAAYISAFMEIIVFAALFTHIYFLIKKLIVNNICKINTALAEITGGNLDVTVDVRENEEFSSLSDDINATVTTLKTYIAEAAARINKELEFARTIQHAALPSIFPPYPGRRDFDIYAQMDAAKEVGGDFYDFYLLDANTIAFLIADVSGKGIPAAMFMMTAKTMIKGLTESGLDVDEVFTKANQKLCDGNEAGMFVTAWIGVLRLDSGLLRYANAGHNPPAIRRGKDGFVFLQSKANFVLAGMEGIKYKMGELRLLPGDTLYLYTDGVTEATNASNALFGEARLLESLNQKQQASMADLCGHVKHAVDRFVREAPQFDDITMLAIRLNYLQENDSIITVPSTESADLVSDFVDIQLEKLAIETKTANRLRIVVDEIYTNIRSYSGASVAKLIMTLENGILTLQFCDNGKRYNPLEAEEPDITASVDERKIGGLGLLMVKKLMDSVTYAYAENQNVLTLTLAAH